MKFKISNCPECGEPPKGIVEELQGLAFLLEQDDGSFEYAGQTDMWWDSQESLEFDGKCELMCCNRHLWFSPWQKS